MEAMIEPGFFASQTLKVHEPFAEFLGGNSEEVSFEISLLDVVRFSGHACPSMVGAFLISREAVQQLYPDTGVLVRGDVCVEVPGGQSDGATGPMANVFSFVFGAWEETGFGGLGPEGRFARRNLLRFASSQVPKGAFRFHRRSTGKCVDIYYQPSHIQPQSTQGQPFQVQWRERISRILKEPEKVLQVDVRVTGR